MINSEIFKDTPLSEEIIIKTIDFLGRYKVGEYLYPNVLLRNLKLSKGDEMCITKSLIKNKLVEVLHYYVCPICGETTNFFSKEYLHTENLICENCGELIDIDNYRLAYKFKLK